MFVLCYIVLNINFFHDVVKCGLCCLCRRHNKAQVLALKHVDFEKDIEQNSLSEEKEMFKIESDSSEESRSPEASESESDEEEGEYDDSDDEKREQEIQKMKQFKKV